MCRPLTIYEETDPDRKPLVMYLVRDIGNQRLAIKVYSIISIHPELSIRIRYCSDPDRAPIDIKMPRDANGLGLMKEIYGELENYESLPVDPYVMSYQYPLELKTPLMEQVLEPGEGSGAQHATLYALIDPGSLSVHSDDSANVSHRQEEAYIGDGALAQRTRESRAEFSRH